MKKLILFILFSFSIGFIYGQRIVDANKVIVRDSMNLNGDWINVSGGLNGDLLQRVSGRWISSTLSLVGWDSLTFTPSTGSLNWWLGGSIVDLYSLDGRYLLLGDTTRYVNYRDSLITFMTPSQTADSLNLIRANMTTNQTVFEITLPAATNTGDRIAGATLPAGWSIAASGVDLIITHSMTRRVASVTVFMVTGTAEQQLFNTAAYNGIISTTSEIVKIQSLGTINKVLKIYIIFV